MDKQEFLEANASITREQVLEKMAPYGEQVAELRRRYPGATWCSCCRFIAYRAGGFWLGAARRHSLGGWSMLRYRRCMPLAWLNFTPCIARLRLGVIWCRFVIMFACHIQGAEDLIGHLENRLDIHAGETTEDGIVYPVAGGMPGILRQWPSDFDQRRISLRSRGTQ